MIINLSRRATKFFLILLSKILNRDRILYYLADEKEVALLHLKKEGFLVDSGWFTSFLNKEPIDASNQPVPWLTYSFIDFIKFRLNNELNVFEFGCGNSTIFFGKKVKSITSVEHDKEWYNKIQVKLPKNSTLIYSSLEESSRDYSRTAISTGMLYDIIIIDGRDRVNCCKNSLSMLKDDGIMILDDSQRDKYQESINYMLDHSFKKLDFCGLAPSSLFYKCTTVFYRNNNCLKI